MKDKSQKRFIVRKYIMATSAADAIRKDKATPVDDCYVDDAWLNEQTRQIGFKTK